MKNGNYSAVFGTVISADDSGMWLRRIDGDEQYITVGAGSAIARPGHEVAAAGEITAAGFEAELLVNRSTGVRWASTPFENLGWMAAIARVAVGHCITLLLMAIPIVNLFVGSFAGIQWAVQALIARVFVRTFALLVLVFAGTGFIAWLLAGLTGNGNGSVVKDAALLWYFVSFPLAYVAVAASVTLGIDQQRGNAQRQLEQTIAEPQKGAFRGE